jgi:hypothetical protein
LIPAWLITQSSCLSWNFTAQQFERILEVSRCYCLTLFPRGQYVSK